MERAKATKTAKEPVIRGGMEGATATRCGHSVSNGAMERAKATKTMRNSVSLGVIEDAVATRESRLDQVTLGETTS